MGLLSDLFPSCDDFSPSFNDSFPNVFKFHSFQQEVTNTVKRYYFIGNLQKMIFHVLASLLIILGSNLGTGLVLGFALSLPSGTISLRDALFIIIGLPLFSILLIFGVVYLIYVIIKILQVRTLRSFTLILEEGKISNWDKLLPVSEELSIHITFTDSFRKRPLKTTKLQFQPRHLFPFPEFDKVEKYLSYHEKRELAEQLSQHLKIPLTDMLSSFEPGIYMGKQNFSEKTKFAKTKPSSSLKLVTKQSPHIIQLPIYKKKTLIGLLVVLLILGNVVVGLNYLEATIRFGFSSARYFPRYTFVFINLLVFLQVIHFFKKDMIFVTDDSIALTRRYIFRTRKIFSSQFSELKDIAIIKTQKSARILFRNEKQTSLTLKNSKQILEEANMCINNLLVSRLQNS